MNTTDNHLESRFSRLERSNRILWILILILMAAILIGVTVPQDIKVVRAERFELIDALGRVHATLERTDAGETGLFIQDDSSRVRIALAHDSSQTALFIRDRAGDVRVGASQFSHGGGGFALHGEQMQGAAVLYLKDQKGSLRMFDKEGKIVYQVPEQ